MQDTSATGPQTSFQLEKSTLTTAEIAKLLSSKNVQCFVPSSSYESFPGRDHVRPEFGEEAEAKEGRG